MAICVEVEERFWIPVEMGSSKVKSLFPMETSHYGRAFVPPGASTGKHEALELRDSELSSWLLDALDIQFENE